jgi:hypothetical protein
MAPTFLITELDRGECSDSHLGRFASGISAPGTDWIGHWVGFRFGLDAVEKRRIWNCRE